MSAYVILTLSALCFGGTWVAGHVAVEALPPLTIAAVRFLIASALLWGWARAQGHREHRIARADLPVILMMGATAIAIYNVLFLYGLTMAPASDGAIIVPGLAPVFTVLCAWLVLQERIGWREAAGFVVAFAGLYLVLRPGGHPTQSPPPHNRAEAMRNRTTAIVSGGRASTATWPATHVPPKQRAERVRMTYALTGRGAYW